MKIIVTILFCFLFSCTEQQQESENQITENPIQTMEKSASGSNPTNANPKKKLDFLALGDSYTKGEALEVSSSFPAQLSKRLESEFNFDVSTKIIAETGWTTENLIFAIQGEESLKDSYGFVTLLIGVNNQFQGLPFNQYEKEFVELLETAIKFAGAKKENVLVLSIPDYAFTPFGKKNEEITKEIDIYNNFAKKSAEKIGVEFLNITDITRMGIEKPELVAMDDLHISKIGYAMFVTRILSLKFLNS